MGVDLQVIIPHNLAYPQLLDFYKRIAEIMNQKTIQYYGDSSAKSSWKRIGCMPYPNPLISNSGLL
jgi:hypothetical protein